MQTATWKAINASGFILKVERKTTYTADWNASPEGIELFFYLALKWWGFDTFGFKVGRGLCYEKFYLFVNFLRIVVKIRHTNVATTYRKVNPRSKFER